MTDEQARAIAALTGDTVEQVQRDMNDPGTDEPRPTWHLREASRLYTELDALYLARTTGEREL